MPRYFMRLAYNGAPFHGWQTQPNAVSVQSTVEEALSLLLRCPTKITGAGRTDAGVNARMMIAHFDTETELKSADGLVRGLNSLCGKDVAVYDVFRVHDDAHARFDAVSRTYHYRAIPFKSPFEWSQAWLAPPSLDYSAMNEAAAHLLTVSDFTSFAKLHSDAKTNICRIDRAEWIPEGDEGGMTFVITADRFLRNMVRAIVGTLVEVGRGKMTLAGFRAVVADRNRCSAGVSMPGHALYLWDIT
ncbi:MAG: tRNA pseudouridine(38-40) synthase TruA, partial [Muribaculaceae bacterium]|nr:tRNA pseudouridine(38-40) synthase TruA [Muribaculaceae bacterium]